MIVNLVHLEKLASGERSVCVFVFTVANEPPPQAGSRVGFRYREFFVALLARNAAN